MSDPAATYIPLARIAGFDAHGKVYRAFDHMIAAQAGSVLLVPLYLARGLITDALDGCPVPWEEIVDLLTLERVAVAPFAPELDAYSDLVNKMFKLAPDGWSVDVINVNRHPQGRAWRFCHTSGIRYAVAADLVPRLPEAAEA